MAGVWKGAEFDPSHFRLLSGGRVRCAMLLTSRKKSYSPKNSEGKNRYKYNAREKIARKKLRQKKQQDKNYERKTERKIVVEIGEIIN